MATPQKIEKYCQSSEEGTLGARPHKEGRQVATGSGPGGRGNWRKRPDCTWQQRSGLVFVGSRARVLGRGLEAVAAVSPTA